MSAVESYTQLHLCEIAAFAAALPPDQLKGMAKGLAGVRGPLGGAFSSSGSAAAQDTPHTR